MLNPDPEWIPEIVYALGLRPGEAASQQRFTGEILQLLAKNFGSESTLNHLRVGHFISLRSNRS
jgi:hypothetical protein